MILRRAASQLMRGSKGAVPAYPFRPLLPYVICNSGALHGPPARTRIQLRSNAHTRTLHVLAAHWHQSIDDVRRAVLSLDERTEGFDADKGEDMTIH